MNRGKEFKQLAKQVAFSGKMLKQDMEEQRAKDRGFYTKVIIPASGQPSCFQHNYPASWMFGGIT